MSDQFIFLRTSCWLLKSYYISESSHFRPITCQYVRSGHTIPSLWLSNNCSKRLFTYAEWLVERRELVPIACIRLRFHGVSPLKEHENFSPVHYPVKLRNEIKRVNFTSSLIVTLLPFKGFGRRYNVSSLRSILCSCLAIPLVL